MPFSGVRPSRRITPEDRVRVRALIDRVDARIAKADAEERAQVRPQVPRGRFRHHVMGKYDRKKMEAR